MLLQPFCNYYGYWACRWCLTNTRWNGAASSAPPNHIESHREMKRSMQWPIVLESLQNFLKGPLCTLTDVSCKGVVGCVDLFICDTVGTPAETLTKVKRSLGSGLSIVVTPTWACHAWHVAHRLSDASITDSLASRHTRQKFCTKPSPCAIPTRYWREHLRGACRDSN
jgi:hypothetical protein